MVKLVEVLNSLKAEKSARSAWDRGVAATAIELVEGQIECLGADGEIDPSDRAKLEKQFLDGAEDWTDYSYGGSAFAHDWDIVERYCTPSYIKHYRGIPCSRTSMLAPGGRESWLELQARALGQAFCKVYDTAVRLDKIAKATRYFDETHPYDAHIEYNGEKGWNVTPDGDKARLIRYPSNANWGAV